MDLALVQLGHSSSFYKYALDKTLLMCITKQWHWHILWYPSASCCQFRD